MSKRRRIWTKHVSSFNPKTGRYATDWKESTWYWQDADAPVAECKSLFSSKKGPSLTPPEGFTDILDEISGVETVQVTTADGRKKLVTRRVARSAEDQAMIDKATEMMNSSLNELDKLLSNDPTASDRYKDVLDAYTERQNRLTSETLTSIIQKRENFAAQTGLDRSSAGDEIRTQDAIRELQARRDNEELVRLKKNELLGEEINKEAQRFAAGEAIINADQAKAEAGRAATTKTGMSYWQQSNANINQANQNALTEYANKGPSIGSQLLKMAAAGTATYFGGPAAGAAVGSAMGGGSGSSMASLGSSLISAGATRGWWGGYDPTTGVTWSTGRQA